MRKTKKVEREECFVSEHTAEGKPSRSLSERQGEIETERETERNRQCKRERTQGR